MRFRFALLHLAVPVSCVLAAGCNPETGIKPSKAPPVERVDPNAGRDAEVMTPDRLRNLLGDDDVQVQVEGGRITRVSLAETGVTDLSPLEGLELKTLDLYNLPIEDISVLKGMPLEELLLTGTKVTDLSPLSGMPLKNLDLIDTPVTDVSVVSTLDLEILWLRGSKVRDLTPLAGQKLTSLDVQDTEVENIAVVPQIQGLERLNIVGTKVTDLTPLEGLELKRLLFTPSKIEQGLDIVRKMDSLDELDVTFREPQRMRPLEFWLKYDAGAFEEKSDEPTPEEPKPTEGETPGTQPE